MKKFEEILPTLTAPIQGEVLMMYLTASTESISAALFVKREEEQVPIYFVSRVLQGYMQQGGYEGLMLIDPEGKEYTYALRFGFETTNNEAEYEVLLASYTIEHIRRNQNKKVDALSKLASMTFEHLTKEVLVEVLPKRSIEEKEILQVETKERESWMTHIHEYLVSGLLPKDPKESRKIRVKAPQYKLIRGNMYRRSFYTPWLRCVASPQTDDIVKEVHKDLCKGLKVTQSFSPITEHMKIMNHIEKQLARSQQGWVDDLAQVLWVHRTIPRNSQKETPFSLTYGSEAIIPISENDVAKDDRGRIKKVDKRRGSKEIASIEEAYYRSKLCRHHNKKSSHSIYKIGDFVLLSQNNTGSTQGFTTEASAGGDIGLETGTEDGAKGSLDANKEIKNDHTLVHELEKQEEKLPIELQLKNNFREALETTSKDLENTILDLNPTLHDLQKVSVDQKKKHYKTTHALKIVDEEFKKAKSEATTENRKLAKVYGAWLSPWLVTR
ncbi:reverse transcriptase domain-containing protein [Tanacetum coccineum]